MWTRLARLVTPLRLTSGGVTSVMVDAPWRTGADTTLAGTLAVRRLEPPRSVVARH